MEHGPDESATGSRSSRATSAEVIWQMKDAVWTILLLPIRDWYVDPTKFRGSSHPGARSCAVVEPHAAVRRAVRLPEQHPARLFHLQTALAAGRGAIAPDFTIPPFTGSQRTTR